MSIKRPPVIERDPASLLLLGSARLDGKRELDLVERGPILLGPGIGGRLQCLEELPLLLVAELEILARWRKAAPVSLDRDSLREDGGRLGDIGSTLELRHKEDRSSLGHAPSSIGEEEADGCHEGEGSSAGSRR
jgi:hypothetical protein